MPRIVGLTREDQLAYIDLIADLVGTPNLNSEIERRALWLLRGLRGNATFDDLRMATSVAA